LYTDSLTYLTGNQTITLSGAVSGSGTTTIATSFASTTPVGFGGTGSTTLITNGVLYGNGAGPVLAAVGTSAQILMANTSGIPTFTTVSGDITIGNTGVTAIGNLKVTNAMIANSTIDLTTKVTGILPIANGGTNSSTLGSTLVGFVANDTNIQGTISSNTLNLSWAGQLSVARGGTGTSTLPTVQGQILADDGTHKYGPTNLVAGSNITINTTTAGSITITGTSAATSASGTPGNIQFAGAAGAFNATNLFNWDNTNLKLSVGTTSTFYSTRRGWDITITYHFVINRFYLNDGVGQRECGHRHHNPGHQTRCLR
jgi:hypothetical protein